MENKKIYILIAIFIVIDQITKYLVYNLGFLNSNYFITPILNKGISWGITLFHFNLLIIMIPLILAGLWYMHIKEEISYLPFILIFAGGLSNFVDRIIFHGVRDFINFHFFPIFNVADVFITIGFIIIFFQLILPQAKN